MNKKELYEKTLKIYKPFYEAIKKQKKEDKEKGVYDLVTITDRFTGEEVQIHVGINCVDKMRKKITNRLKMKILYGE